jgi:nucleobase:cation symporter-1, NCS1 family
MSTSLAETAPDRHYGARVAAVEPGGAEVIPLAERHGKPLQMLWTWTSPNMEFATIYVGVICVLFFGLSFWQSVAAIVLGNLLGSITQMVLSSWGPETGFCQMVLSRRAFGFLGNFLPAGLNWLVAGIGWFAVNSVSGALALSALTGLNKYLSLVVVVALMLALAYFGHNLIQVFEKYAAPALTLIFIVGGIVLLSKSHTSAVGAPIPGGFWIALGATFGYAAGWNPYASDYTRYLAPGTGRLAGIFSGLGVFVSCVLLEVFGAAAVTAFGGAAFDFDSPNWVFANPTGAYTSLMPTWLGKLTLLGICLGAIAANALNVYSSALSFAAMGIIIKAPSLRAIVATVMSIAGFVVALVGIDNISSYENFLLVISYWIGPWLGVVLMDRILRRARPDELSYIDRSYVNWAGPIAMFVGAVISIWLFSNQQFYTGILPTHMPQLGDLTFEVGFLIAAGLYAVLYRSLAQPITVATPEQLAVGGRR